MAQETAEMDGWGGDDDNDEDDDDNGGGGGTEAPEVRFLA